MSNDNATSNEDTQQRYDRQLRLWGEGGQSSIERASVCVLGSKALASEILKSLVLPGVGRFCVVDDARVHVADLGQNFFLTENDVGKSRAAAVAKHLSELNPAACGEFRERDPTSMTNGHLLELLGFTLVVATCLDERTAAQLGDYLLANGVYFVYARVCGMIGYVRVVIRQHTVWNTHVENAPHDFHLDKPFDELRALVDAERLEEMEHERHAHTPYLILYAKALQKWRQQQSTGQTSATIPDTFQRRKEFERVLMAMRRPNESGSLDEENFNEAKRNLIRSFHNEKIPSHVAAVFADVKTAPVEKLRAQSASATHCHELLQPFWLFAAALREFVAQHGGRLPLSGALPDMTSDSERYVKLQRVYRDKAMKHADEMFAIAKRIQRERREQLFDAPSAAAPLDASLIASDSATTRMNASPSTEPTKRENVDEFPLISALSPTHVPIAFGTPLTFLQDTDTVMDVDVERVNLRSSSLTMTTTKTVSYGVYRNGVRVAGDDKEQFQRFNTSVKASAVDESLAWNDCVEFCRNAAKIAVQNGTSTNDERIEELLRKIAPADDNAGKANTSDKNDKSEEQPTGPSVDPLVWVALLKAADRFSERNSRRPGVDGPDSAQLKLRLRELLDESKLTSATECDELCNRVPDVAIAELCRYGDSEPHVVAAVLGGVVAQEVIKLVTHQYLPLDNALVYDGHSQTASAFRI